MKKRLVIDRAIAFSLGLLALGFYLYPKTFLIPTPEVDRVLDFLGIVLIIKGIMIRAAARGHKRNFPRWDLVLTGPYAYMRNPMYVGSFTAGCGMVLVACPWWLLPIFATAFYFRFNQEVVKEEEQLIGCHKENYKAYCQKTPRIFPRLKTIWTAKTKDIFPFEDMLSTQETRNLLVLPFVAFIFDCVQAWRLFGHVNVGENALFFLGSIFIFIVAFAISYKVR